MRYLLFLIPTFVFADVPNTFEPGAVAEAHAVNENFDVLDAKINENKAAIVQMVDQSCPCESEYVAAMQLYMGLGGVLTQGSCIDNDPQDFVAPETETTYTTGNLRVTLHAEIQYGDEDFYACKVELTNPDTLLFKRESVTQTENLNPWIASCQALVESYCVLP